AARLRVGLRRMAAAVLRLALGDLAHPRLELRDVAAAHPGFEFRNRAAARHHRLAGAFGGGPRSLQRALEPMGHLGEVLLLACGDRGWRGRNGRRRGGASLLRAAPRGRRGGGGRVWVGKTARQTDRPPREAVRTLHAWRDLLGRALRRDLLGRAL